MSYLYGEEGRIGDDPSFLFFACIFFRCGFVFVIGGVFLIGVFFILIVIITVFGFFLCVFYRTIILIGLLCDGTVSGDADLLETECLVQEEGADLDAECEIKEKLETEETIEPLRESVNHKRSKEPYGDQEDGDREVLDTQKDGIDDRLLQCVFKGAEKSKSVKEYLDDQKDHDPDRVLQEREGLVENVWPEIDEI